MNKRLFSMANLALLAMILTMVAGVGQGYDRPVDQDFWHDDGSAEFATLWEETADQAVFK